MTLVLVATGKNLDGVTAGQAGCIRGRWSNRGRRQNVVALVNDRGEGLRYTACLPPLVTMTWEGSTSTPESRRVLSAMAFFSSGRPEAGG